MKRVRAYLSTIWRIFARDIKRIFRNPIAVIVLVGVCLLPSLYAWYIVAANWDPYQNTGNLRVAIVNQDEGAESGHTGAVNVGAQVVETLKENHDLGWEFTDEDTAMQSVRSGECFAAIVFPKEFSADFLSAFSGSFKRPQIEYYVNEKLSGSGTKMVDAGVHEVQNAINAQFVKTVSDRFMAESQHTAQQVEADTESAEAGYASSLDAVNADIGATQAEMERLKNTVLAIQPPDIASAAGGEGAASAEVAQAIDSLQSSLSSYIDTAKSEVAGVTGASSALLSSVQGSLEDVLSSMDALQSSASMADLKAFLGLNDEEVADFLAQPVSLDTHKVYPVANYGSGVAPFFTNLALWVSSLLVLALMRIRVDREGLPPFTDVQAYFGRWLLLMVVCVVQSTVVCAGDVIMGIQCVSPPAFIGAGILAGIVYANLMFALVYSMRHVGKALAIILLIIQIPGSSGMFPIQMMPEFFQVLNPLLPFTYSIDAMREAIGGFYGLHYLQNMLVLALVFLPIGFLIGLVFGKYSYNLNVMFDKQLAEGGLYSTETVLGGTRTMRFGKMLMALMRTPEYRMKIKKRAKRFSARYKKLVRAGWCAIFALLAGMFVVMAVVRGGVNATLLVLTLFVLGVLMAVAYLIALTYVDMNIESKLRLTGSEHRIKRGERGGRR